MFSFCWESKDAATSWKIYFVIGTHMPKWHDIYNAPDFFLSEQIRKIPNIVYLNSSPINHKDNIGNYSKILINLHFLVLYMPTQS